MSKEAKWDFECPQFVDFVAGLDNSGKEDVFFDCKDHQSPEGDCIIKASPVVNNEEEYLTEEAENRLLDKMNAALSIIENTPNVKKSAVKGKVLSEMFSKNLHPQEIKSTIKQTTMPARLHRSKSVVCLNRINSEKATNSKECGLRKRSSSLNDLRTCKKQKYPVTPMCLKRTIVKAKAKVLKSTEEMELEQIAKMQKQLIRHLRYNEMTLKKLRLKPKPVVPKTQAKPENSQQNKGLNIVAEKLKAIEKETGHNVQALNSAAIKNKSMKINSIINNYPCQSKKADNGSNPQRLTKPSVPSVSSEVAEESGIQVTKKTTKSKKFAFHSGLTFHYNVKKKTTVKPFSFDSKIKESKIQNIDAEPKAEISALRFKVDVGKENIPFVKKAKGNQNTKYDTNNKLTESYKSIEKKVPKPIRGLPLSENVSRH